jgi:hypothetical protein
MGVDWEIVGKLGVFASVALIIIIVTARLFLKLGGNNGHVENLLGGLGGPSVSRAWQDRKRGKPSR